MSRRRKLRAQTVALQQHKGSQQFRQADDRSSSFPGLKVLAFMYLRQAQTITTALSFRTSTAWVCAHGNILQCFMPLVMHQFDADMSLKQPIA